MVSVKHSFTSPKPDSADSSLVQASHWNAEHIVVGTNEGYWSQDFNFALITPGQNLVIGSNSVNLGTLPRGVLTNDLLYISGGTGAAEVVPVTGISGLTNVIITCANAHSGSYTIRSASAGIMEAMLYMLSINPGGGEVRISPGISTIYGLVIGNGVGVTDSTIQNITLRGVGKGPDDYLLPNAAGSDLVWAGPTNGTVLKVNGPIRALHFCDFRINGNSNAFHLLDIYSCQLSVFDRLTLVLPAVSGDCLRIEAGAGFNAPSDNNMFTNISFRAMASKSSSIKLGTVPVNFNSGTFNNVFTACKVFYKNDHPDSTGIYLGWADNNRFSFCQIQPVDTPGTGFAITHVRQAGQYDFLPSENIFMHCQTGYYTSTLTNGQSGRGVGTIFWPYQTFDSSPVPNDYKGIRGFIENGTFFDTSNKMTFQRVLRVHSPQTFALFNVLGFSGNPGAGKITTSGVNVLGTDGTLFTTQLKVGKCISISNEFRTIESIADDTHCVMAFAFDEDMINQSYEYQTGVNLRVLSDANARFGCADQSNTCIQSGGQDVATFDPAGNMTSIGKISGTIVDNEYGNAGPNTISVNVLINGLIRRTAGGAQTDTTPTAALIIAALTQCAGGQSFNFTVMNSSGGLHTLGLGTGVLNPVGVVNTLTTASGNVHRFMFRVHDNSLTTPSVYIYSLGQSAS